MSLLDSLNDSSWSLLEKFKLDDFFQDHNLPPILFPIAILFIVLLVGFLLIGTAPSDATEASLDAACGDGFCNSTSENLISCPSDCSPPKTQLKTVRVLIEGTVKNTIEVTLEGGDRSLIKTTTGKENEFTFSGVSRNSVVVIVRNTQNSEVYTSDLITLEGDETDISITLSDEFFEKSNIPPKGTLQIFLKDKNSGDPLSGKVTISTPNGASRTVVSTESVDTAESFTLDANIWHAISVNVDGYEPYTGDDSLVMLEEGDSRKLTIKLKKLAADAEPAQLTLCVKDQDGNLLSGGVDIYDVSSTLLQSEFLNNGCASLELTAQLITASTSDLPENCLDTNSEITLDEGQNSIDLIASCLSTEPGYARVKILNESGDILTQDAWVSMWYEDGTRIWGTGSSWTLSLGTGGYTEYVEVDTTKKFYYMVTNLDGYASITSEEYSIDAGENKSIIITASPPPPPVFNVTVRGVTYASPVSTLQEFSVSVSNVLYGRTDVTSSSNVSMTLAGVDCEMDGSIARCLAPLEDGEYDLAVTASYEGREGIEVFQITVLGSGRNYLFDLIPHLNLDKETPIVLNFDIKFNGTLVTSLTDTDVTIYYVAGGTRLENKPTLTGNNGTYTMSVSTPFPGDHKAEIYLQKIIYGKLYEQNFTYYFEADPINLKVSSEESISPRVLLPNENFDVYVRLTYNGDEIEDLENVYVTIDEQKTNLEWDSDLHTYTTSFTSSDSEGIYTALFELEYQELDSINFYVIDTDKSKSSECVITACDTRPHVRKCVDKHKAENFYSEADTISCIEDGWAIQGVDLLCLSSAGNSGDWDNSCTLTSSDISIHTNALRIIPDQLEINEYQACGDMDNDNDVDEADKTCLTNVVSTKWFGDKGDGSCSTQMKGGFCYDIETTSSLKGDFDTSGQITQEDVDVMTAIIADVNKGVTAPEELMAFADFNQDDRINNADKTCLESFKDLNIQEMIQNVQQDIANMPDFDYDCLNVYNISCGGSQGDLNTDGVIDEIDLLVLGLIASDIGGILTNSQGEDVEWQQEFTVSQGQTKNLARSIPYNKDWVIEMDGTFNFDALEETDYFFRDPTFGQQHYLGKFHLTPYAGGLVSGQTLAVSPSFGFSLAGDEYGPLIGVPIAYKGLPGFGNEDATFMLTLRVTPPTGKLRIEYFYEEKRVRIYWNKKLVGHYEIEKNRGNPFNWAVSQLHFKNSRGTFRYYVGDLDPYMTPFGSLECADFNEDGVIDETDFLCMSLMLFDMNSFIDSEVCESCTQRGLKEGWYSSNEICWDGYDNDCDTTVDIARLGSRVDSNACDWCPDAQQGSVGGTWCWEGPFWDLDRGASPGIDDGNYGICMSQSWAHTDHWGNAVAPLVRHIEHANDAHEPECTPAMECHFTSCFDNYRICAGGSNWRQFGGGASSDSTQFVDSEGTVTNDPYGVGTSRHEWVQEYSPSATESTYGPNAESESSGAPETTITPEGASTTTVVDAESGYRISMDNEHYIGSRCQTLDINGESYNTYYGPWGDFLECEGKCPAGTSSYCAPGDTECTPVECLADDGWDNNCYAGDAPDYTDSGSSGWL